MQSDGLNSALSPVVYGDIALSINTQYNTMTTVYMCKTTLTLEDALFYIKEPSE